jgi:hypothetical protein
MAALSEQPCVGVGGAGVGVLDARATLPVRLGVAPGAAVGVVAAAVLRREALVAGSGLDEGAVHRKVLLAQQPSLVGQCHDLGEEALDHAMLQQLLRVLVEAGVVPDLIVDGEVDEPPLQQVVAHLLHQLALAAHGEQHLGEHGPQQLLRGDGGPAAVGLDQVEQPVQAAQRFVDRQADRAHRLICRHEVVELGYHEHRLLHPVRSSNRLHPVFCTNTVSTTTTAQTTFARGRNSTAC